MSDHPSLMLSSFARKPDWSHYHHQQQQKEHAKRSQHAPPARAAARQLRTRPTRAKKAAGSAAAGAATVAARAATFGSWLALAFAPGGAEALSGEVAQGATAVAIQAHRVLLDTQQDQRENEQHEAREQQVTAQATVHRNVQIYHPGHAAVHVTRLHRYDHSGIEAMMEEEARWMRGDVSSPSDRSNSNNINSNSNNNDDRDSAAATIDASGDLVLGSDHAPDQKEAKPGFLQLGSQQVAGLLEHQQKALVQLSEKEVTSQLSRPRRHQRLVDYRTRQKTVPKDKPAVTRLDSLDSQYVGPIGVGTVTYPANCKTAEGQSLIFLDSTEEEIRANKSSSNESTCHIVNQAKIWVVFDTGSTNLWVSSDLCQSGPCSRLGRARYDHLQSSTFADPAHGVYLNIEFGTGKISGPQGVDDFHVGPFTVYKQTFGMIEVQEGKVFDEVPFEGILGLAFPKMSANGARALFDNIIEQKALENNEFAFYFSLDNPSANAILWGGVDKNFYDGPIEYFHVDDPYYWSTNLKSFSIGDKEYLGDGSSGLLQVEDYEPPVRQPKAIVDTGTTFFTAEGDLFDKVMDRLPAALCRDVTETSHPPITFRLQRVDGEPRDFTLTHDQYMTQQGDGSWSDTCSPAFMRINIPKQHGPAMVLGEVFLRHFFAVFDRGTKSHPEDVANARLGFAKAKHGLAVNQHLRALTPNQPSFQISKGTDEATGISPDGPDE
eukprot:CAMPEP_0206444612 /NCGR_PEP_ID=MMETSP0324_2-20121206/15012_1 /ASSEMBLY_ACC=CAM_ASM_000836 /TAXON_ID=2866 /ORGANISM="Crypthecodinium cohnii, Strain Seligo" /LENGTH=718 /DNA_ID=CAMNT_0053912661 /DNA_START=135 /DNA_END=2291 /DNA_ORIENTATION=-